LSKRKQSWESVLRGRGRGSKSQSGFRMTRAGSAGWMNRRVVGRWIREPGKLNRRRPQEESSMRRKDKAAWRRWGGWD